MKKVLVATCVIAMAAFGITNASADPMDNARASAYGINLQLLGNDLIDQEPEVTSVLPPGGPVTEDILTPDVQPVTIAGTGVVLANTSRESTIVPYLSEQRGETSPLAGGGGDAGTLGGTLGGIFDNLLGGALGGGGGGTVGGLTEGVTGGTTGGTVGGLTDNLPVGALSDDSGAVEAQQLDGLTGGGDGGLLGGLLGGDLLGGLLNNPEGGDVADDEISIPAVNAQALSRIEDLNLVVEDATGLGALDTEVLALLVDALVEIEAVTAEAVAVCVDNQVFFDTASMLVSTDNQPVTLVDSLVDAVEGLADGVLAGLIDVDRNEVGVTADGEGVFVNALHITLLGGGALGGDGGGGLLGGLLGGATDGIVPTSIPVGADSSGEGEVQIQQVGGNEPVLDIIVGHAEVSGSVCAAPPPPSTVPTLVPTGDVDTLPVTGGGLGILPAALALGLTGGAVAAGRLALRARREQNL